MATWKEDTIQALKNLGGFAGGGLNIVFGLGAMGGPIVCSIFMNKFGPNSFFIFLLIFHVINAIFAFYMMTIRSTEDNADSTFAPLPKNIILLGMEFDPKIGVNLPIVG